jgi:hypothetical protein
MGINLHAFNFLYYNSKIRKFGKTLTIGRQKITADKISLKNTIKDNIVDEIYLDNYLLKYFGATSVDSIDINDYEDSNIIYDLNYNVPKELENKYDTIIDSGSLEHIFNIKVAMKNFSVMCKEKGLILHISPSNNFCGHGFYQFSPELFHTYYNIQNNFKDTEIYLAKVYDSNKWFKINEENFNNDTRINIITDEETFILCKTIKNKQLEKDIILQGDYSKKFYLQKKKIYENNNSVPIQSSKLRSILIKISNFLPIIKKFYNYFRKTKNYKLLKLNKNNPNILIINVKKILS